VQEEDLAHKLDGVKYDIDSPDSIQLFGFGRIENVCCLLGALVSIVHTNGCSVLAAFALPRCQETFTDYETRRHGNSSGNRTPVSDAKHPKYF
jgi:hypothetical protein